MVSSSSVNVIGLVLILIVTHDLLSYLQFVNANGITQTLLKQSGINQKEGVTVLHPVLSDVTFELKLSEQFLL